MMSRNKTDRRKLLILRKKGGEKGRKKGMLDWRDPELGGGLDDPPPTDQDLH